jgi:hypothetical protein
VQSYTGLQNGMVMYLCSALLITGHLADGLSLAALIVDQSRFHTGLTTPLRSEEKAAETSASRLVQFNCTLQVVIPCSHRHKRSYGHEAWHSKSIINHKLLGRDILSEMSGTLPWNH